MYRLILITAFLFYSTFSIAGEAIWFEGKPRSLDDGDTVVMHFRFQGIDTPEKAQMCEDTKGTCYRCGDKATEALRKLVTGPNGKLKLLRFRYWETGYYGRPVVTPYDGTKDLSLELIRQGWAIAYRKYLVDELKSDYLAAEAEAQAAKRGMWQGKFIEPSHWRKGNRLACER